MSKHSLIFKNFCFKYLKIHFFYLTKLHENFCYFMPLWIWKKWYIRHILSIKVGIICFKFEMALDFMQKINYNNLIIAFNFSFCQKDETVNIFLWQTDYLFIFLSFDWVFLFFAYKLANPPTFLLNLTFFVFKEKYPWKL